MPRTQVATPTLDLHEALKYAIGLIMPRFEYVGNLWRLIGSPSMFAQLFRSLAFDSEAFRKLVAERFPASEGHDPDGVWTVTQKGNGFGVNIWSFKSNITISDIQSEMRLRNMTAAQKVAWFEEANRLINQLAETMVDYLVSTDQTDDVHVPGALIMSTTGIHVVKTPADELTPRNFYSEFANIIDLQQRERQVLADAIKAAFFYPATMVVPQCFDGEPSFYTYAVDPNWNTQGHLLSYGQTATVFQKTVKVRPIAVAMRDRTWEYTGAADALSIRLRIYAGYDVDRHAFFPYDYEAFPSERLSWYERTILASGVLYFSLLQESAETLGHQPDLRLMNAEDTLELFKTFAAMASCLNGRIARVSDEALGHVLCEKGYWTGIIEAIKAVRERVVI